MTARGGGTSAWRHDDLGRKPKPGEGRRAGTGTRTLWRCLIAELRATAAVNATEPPGAPQSLQDNPRAIKRELGGLLVDVEIWVRRCS